MNGLGLYMKNGVATNDLVGAHAFHYSGVHAFHYSMVDCCYFQFTRTTSGPLVALTTTRRELGSILSFQVIWEGIHCIVAVELLTLSRGSNDPHPEMRVPTMI